MDKPSPFDEDADNAINQLVVWYKIPKLYNLSIKNFLKHEKIKKLILPQAT